MTVRKDFPNTYREFVQYFPNDNVRAAYSEQMRWPAGFCCPSCQTRGEPWRQTRGRLVCSACRHQTSVMAGTIMEKTRTPLTTWFEAAWYLTTAKNGFLAKTLVSFSKPSHQFLNEAISQRINSFPDNAEPNGIAMT